jgi:putative endonuclease
MARYDLIATYIMASGPNATLYTGVTSDLQLRASLHRDGGTPGFTQRYGCNTLVWYQRFYDMQAAIAREKQIKSWPRAWKVRLIEDANPHWLDRFGELS